jgi:hypothetical protein
VTRPAYVFRAAALLSGGAFAVHQLRYVLGFGDDAAHVLHVHGHGYLSALTPILSLVLAGVLGQLIWAAAQRPVETDSRPLGFGRLWLLVASALAAVYIGQELLEGVFSHGHPNGFAGVFGDGGWTAMPLAVVVGAIVAVGLRIGAAIDRAAPLQVLRTSRPLVPALWPAVAAATRVGTAPCPIALGAAERAPPSLV